jgi:hypothetical protein
MYILRTVINLGDCIHISRYTLLLLFMTLTKLTEVCIEYSIVIQGPIPQIMDIIYIT